jgi:cytochrome c
VTRRTLLVTTASLLCLYIPAHAQEAAATITAGDAARGKQVFSICAPCHAISQESNRMGPHLVNIINRPAGSIANFNYSQAMKDAGTKGLVWTDEELSQFLASPKKFLPGTSMRFFGFWTQDKVDDLIAYLKEQSAEQQAPKP